MRGPVPPQSARSVGLHYVSDDRPGIRRRMSALGFQYFRPGGRRITNAAELTRIARLAIPPAWTDVWICPDPRGHLQATGRDARGRKQYRYHADWRRVRDETKYERMPAFAAALPRIRARAAADLAKPGLPREKVLATVVQLLEKSLIRVGNDEYAKANGSFGLTTLRDDHVKVRGSVVRFDFRGKSGKRHSVAVNDRRLARIVKNCRDLPGQELFQYVDESGRRSGVGSGDVNEYLRTISGADFTAKDFRTWAGTVLACAALRDITARQPEPVRANLRRRSAGPPPRHVLQAIDAVAGLLGNTRAVCRSSYIHPAVIDAYADGTLHRVMQKRRSHTRQGAYSPDEAVALAILQRGSTKQTRRQAA